MDRPISCDGCTPIEGGTRSDRVGIDLSRGKGAPLSKGERDRIAVWIDLCRATGTPPIEGERDRIAVWIDLYGGTGGLPPWDSWIPIVG